MCAKLVALRRAWEQAALSLVICSGPHSIAAAASHSLTATSPMFAGLTSIRQEESSAIISAMFCEAAVEEIGSELSCA